MSLAANALTTVARVKDAASLSCSDSRIEFLINEVSEDFEKYTGRELGYVEVTSADPDLYKGNDLPVLQLRRLPIVEITRVRIYGAEITDYLRTKEDDKWGRLNRSTGCTVVAFGFPRDGILWPDLTGDRQIGDEVQSWNIDICGKFGFILPQFDGIHDTAHNPGTLASNLSAGLEGACIREVINRAQAPVQGLKSERTAGGWQQDWDTTTKDASLFGFSRSTLDMLASYCMSTRFFA